MYLGILSVPSSVIDNTLRQWYTHHLYHRHHARPDGAASVIPTNILSEKYQYNLNCNCSFKKNSNWAASVIQTNISSEKIKYFKLDIQNSTCIAGQSCYWWKINFLVGSVFSTHCKPGLKKKICFKIYWSGEAAWWTASHRSKSIYYNIGYSCNYACQHIHNF